MTTTKGTKPVRAAASGHEDDMDKLVTQAEKVFAHRDQMQLVDLIDADTRGVLTLFPYQPRNVAAGKTYPVMTGHLDTRRLKIAVSAFAKTSEEGREFLSLSIGPQGQDHIGGAVFRQEEQNQIDGLWELAPGKENDRYGVIGKTVHVPRTDGYQTVFELRFYGRRRLSSAGVPYIKAQVYPERKTGDVMHAMEGCF